MDLPDFGLRLWVVIITIVTSIFFGFVHGWTGYSFLLGKSRGRTKYYGLLVEIVILVNMAVPWVDVVSIYYSWLGVEGKDVFIGLRALIFVVANFLAFMAGFLLLALTQGISELGLSLRRRLYFCFRKIDEEVLEKVTDMMKLSREETIEPEVRAIVERVFRTGVVPSVGFPKQVWINYRWFAGVL